MVLPIGIPIKLLHEAQGLVLTVELSNGCTYRGRLLEVEDSMNCQLTDVTVTERSGQVRTLQHCFLRGSAVRMFIVPDNLRFAPMFKTGEQNAIGGRVVKGKGMGMGRGRQEVQRVQAARGGLMVSK
jgi:small nuclear ribonucleoprotein D3